MQVKFTFEEDFDMLYEYFNNNSITKGLLKLDGISEEKTDIGIMSQKYFTKKLSEASIDMNANANEELSANNYHTEITKGILKLEGYYLLWRYVKKNFGEKRATELLSSIWAGEVYFHDASGYGISVPYCFAYSTQNLMFGGRPYGQLHSLPPKRADSFISQVIETTMDLSQEFVGAIGLSDVIANYCYYAKKENLNDKRVLNDLQKLVHVLNNKFRVSGQSPFSNISLFDKINLKKLFHDSSFCYLDGSKPDLEYVMKVQKLFGDWFSEGDPVTGLPYRFPIVTVNLSVDQNREIGDRDFLNWIAKNNIKKGVFNIYINEGNKIATCCRYSNDFEQANYRSDTFGNGGLNIGSHRVVTLNLPRIALDCNRDISLFYSLLKNRLEKTRDLLLVHREFLKRRIEQGFLKFFNPLKWFTLDRLFSTIGIIGVYEMGIYMDLPMETDMGQDFVDNVLSYIENFARETSKELKTNFNVEEIPGESAAVTLAKKDKLFYPNTANFELYSNQYVPLIADVDVINRIKLTGRFMKYLSGGGILHLNVQEKISDPEKMKKLIELSVKEGVEHLGINYGFGICKNKHTTIVGTGSYCPICNEEIEDRLSRIIGYFTKISSWNEVRKNYEYSRRKFNKV